MARIENAFNSFILSFTQNAQNILANLVNYKLKIFYSILFFSLNEPLMLNFSVFPSSVVSPQIAKDDAENLEAKYDAASLNNTYADVLEKNNRWQEAFEHRQKVLDAIVPLEKMKIILNFTRLIFFSSIVNLPALPPNLGKKTWR